MASLHVSFLPILINIVKRNVVITKKIADEINIVKFAVIGLINAVIPNTRVEFVITEPVAFPKLIIVFLDNAAFIPNINSGSEVPNAIKKRPIIIEGTWRSVAIKLAYLTTRLALVISRNNPSAKKPKSLKTSVPLTSFSPPLNFFLWLRSLVVTRKNRTMSTNPSNLDKI